MLNKTGFIVVERERERERERRVDFDDACLHSKDDLPRQQARWRPQQAINNDDAQQSTKKNREKISPK